MIVPEEIGESATFSSLAPEEREQHPEIEGFDRLVGKGVSCGAARSEAPNTHGLDVHIVGAGNSGGRPPSSSPPTRAASPSSAGARHWRRACPAT